MRGRQRHNKTPIKVSHFSFECLEIFKIFIIISVKDWTNIWFVPPSNFLLNPPHPRSADFFFILLVYTLAEFVVVLYPPWVLHFDSYTFSSFKLKIFNSCLSSSFLFLSGKVYPPTYFKNFICTLFSLAFFFLMSNTDNRIEESIQPSLCTT